MWSHELVLVSPSQYALQIYFQKPSNRRKLVFPASSFEPRRRVQKLLESSFTNKYLRLLLRLETTALIEDGVSYFTIVKFNQDQSYSASSRALYSIWQCNVWRLQIQLQVLIMELQHSPLRNVHVNRWCPRLSEWVRWTGSHCTRCSFRIRRFR